MISVRLVKSASKLREEMARGQAPSGVYGDACGAREFSDAESQMLRAALSSEWRTVWAGMTQWTIISVDHHLCASACTACERFGPHHTRFEETMISVEGC